MAPKPLIAPSILSADFARLGEEIAEAERAGADWIHVDVMDGHFAPNLSMGPAVLQACKRVTDLPLDVHLMIAQPERYLETFAEAGASHLSVHVEASTHIHRTLQRIGELGCKAGLVLNPGTPAESLYPVLHLADIVLVMSVNPGYSGQDFLPEVLPKVRQIRQQLDKRNLDAIIEMDGGINAQTLPKGLEAGAEAFVASKAIYKYKDGIQAGIEALRNASKLEKVGS